jgi:hypothetical protein
VSHRYRSRTVARVPELDIGAYGPKGANSLGAQVGTAPSATTAPESMSIEAFRSPLPAWAARTRRRRHGFHPRRTREPRRRLPAGDVRRPPAGSLEQRQAVVGDGPVRSPNLARPRPPDGEKARTVGREIDGLEHSVLAGGPLQGRRREGPGWAPGSPMPPAWLTTVLNLRNGRGASPAFVGGRHGESDEHWSVLRGHRASAGRGFVSCPVACGSGFSS